MEEDKLIVAMIAFMVIFFVVLGARELISPFVDEIILNLISLIILIITVYLFISFF